MAIRKQQKVASASIVPGVQLNLNPFQQTIGTARILRNWHPNRNRLLRKPFAPQFHTTASTATGSVWDIIDFNFHRASAPESQLLIFRSDGKIYKRTGGAELEIFPGSTGLAALSSRPQPIQLGNFLVWSDTETAYIYDGRTIRLWGITRDTVFGGSNTSVVAGGSIGVGAVTVTMTWVILDEAGNRVHESSRSDIASETTTSGNETIRVSIASPLLTIPSDVTHWSIYISEGLASAVRRRIATTVVATTSVDVTSLPAATVSAEPIRNDPPPASPVMAVWKNRALIRDDDDPRRARFTAFGEVDGLINGAGAESVPGSGVNSVSDLTNEFLFPTKTIGYVEHENQMFVYTPKTVHVIMGTGGVLDALGNRDLVSGRQFTKGAAGPRAMASTTHGLAWMTSGRQIWLWPGGDRIIDIGFHIQEQLDEIPEADLADVTFKWWDGNGKEWLLITLNVPDAESLTGTATNRILGYDLSRPLGEDTPGQWFEWTDITATVVGEYTDGGQRFLLVGDSSGNVSQLDTICDPAHLNRSMILGETYLGSSIQNNPAAKMRTGLMLPNSDSEAVGLYISFVRGTQDGPTTSVGSNPTLLAAIDPIDPDTAPTITLTPGSAKNSGEFEAWLLPETGGVEGGALARQFLFQSDYAAGSSNNGESDGRTTVALEAIFKEGFSWQIAPDRSE